MRRIHLAALTLLLICSAWVIEATRQEPVSLNDTLPIGDVRFALVLQACLATETLIVPDGCEKRAFVEPTT